MGSSGRHQDLREGGTLSCGHGLGVIPTPWPRKAPPLPSPPPEAKGARGPRAYPTPQLQGHESAGSCPGLTPNHVERATSVPPGEAAWGGSERPLGKPVGLSSLLLLDGLPSPDPVPTLSSGPRSTVCTPGALPHRRLPEP